MPTLVFPSCEDSIGCMHGSSEPDLRNWKSARCTHLQTQPGRIQPIDSSHLAARRVRGDARAHLRTLRGRCARAAGQGAWRWRAQSRMFWRQDRKAPWQTQESPARCACAAMGLR
ncbi:hypothetical protein L564_2389 [Bordetella pertussis CHLA-15]|nr:hypothetical protein L564_2389 [Bordetella pertussis CHLA-15]